MKRILVSIMVFAFLSGVSDAAFSQKDPGSGEDKRWSLGLQAGPLFTKAYGRNYTGFSFQPGVYYTTDKLMLGAVPYFARFSDDYQGSFYDPADQRSDTFTYGGINFHARYFFGNGRIRPYMNGYLGAGYMWDQLERQPEYGGNRTSESKTFNLGLGVGATYRLNNRLVLDLKVEQGFIRHVDFGTWNQSLSPSLGVFWQF